MATSSISHQIMIKDKDAAEKLIKAIEESYFIVGVRSGKTRINDMLKAVNDKEEATK